MAEPNIIEVPEGDLTQFIREHVREHGEFRHVARAASISLGAIYNLKNKDQGETYLSTVEALVPVIFPGYKLAIVKAG